MTELIDAPDAVRFFVNGQAMRGGPLHEPLARSGQFLGCVHTAARYRFWACRGEFPAIAPAPDGGWRVPGEVHLVSYGVLRDEILPSEPEELELSVIELDDGSGALGMRLRAGVTPGDLELTEIEPGTGWHDYLGVLTGDTAGPEPGR